MTNDPVPLSSQEMFPEGRVPDGTVLSMGTIRRCANLLSNELAATILLTDPSDTAGREAMFHQSQVIQTVYAMVERELAAMLGMDTSIDPNWVDDSDDRPDADPH